MISPSFLRFPLLPVKAQVWNGILVATGLIMLQAHAKADLQLTYGVGSANAAALAGAPAHTTHGIDVALRLEYELITRIGRLAETTQELHVIVEAMPGPGLPVQEPPIPSPVQYVTPLDETMARLNHVEQLVADITQIIQDMPATLTADTVAPSSTPVVAAVQPAPKPKPRPKPVPSTPTSIATQRTVALIFGGLVASLLALYLRRQFMRKRPSRKELAAAIEPPPLQDDAIELAEVMASMGLADGAAQALVDRIRTNPRQALSHWLKLLDIYRQTGSQAEFEKAAEEMRTAFNVRPGDWSGKETGSRDTSLENYPHIAAQLKKLWPKPECTEYLLSLLADNRDGKRAGFPLSVVEEIVLLLAMLRDEEQPG